MSLPIRLYIHVVFIFSLTACASNRTYTIQIHPPIEESAAVKQLALFLDGTRNNRDSRTNVSALSEIVKHQDKDNLYIFYNEGVGTGTKFLGAGTGLGIDKDVAEAYKFLSEYYSPDSKLYIFGFSRGAYTSRILAGLIYSVGIYDLTPFEKRERLEISRQLYKAYKGKDKDTNTIRESAKNIINKWRNTTKSSVPVGDVKLAANVSIDILGLWDTVEALGIVPTIEAAKRKILGIKDPQNMVNPNGRYIDQICNIKHVYQALSLDDNRANVFTPIIISSEHVASRCDPHEASISKVDEVWFSGAHADIGGGYAKNSQNKQGCYTDRDVSLSGLSLNWMMSKIKEAAPDLLPKSARVFANPLAYSHNAENGDFKYKSVPRHNILSNYKQYSRYKILEIHESVFERLSLPAAERKMLGYDSEWYKLAVFRECFDVGSDGEYTLKECSLIRLVN